MLTVRVTAPHELARRLRDRLREEPTVSDIVYVPSAALDGDGDLLHFALARENANNVMRMLRHAGVPANGSIVVSEPIAVASDAATAAERAAPGHPADGVLWAQLADRSREDARPSWSFFAFLLLATLIAGIGRLLDQPILIIGAMVVGPEFAPIAAICYAVVRRKRGIVGMASVTLFGGFALSAAIAWGVWAIVYAFGLITYEQATTGPLTEFIIAPDVWSFVIALLAGIAGVLSLTTSKSSALVGVFISITTVPAVGTIGLTLAVGAWDEAFSALLQLLVNLAGLFVAGIATLWVQLKVGRRIGRRLAARRERRSAAQA
ncbi:DUF389 domain-containing protein [Microbacterium sp. QXD-8]|jgi:uncharacterized hydrophobic protein (TIGR00271 family)|uniref:DUF389 domain-containing protein n=1 Tax=Microbacterium psychrotolerans TaxID=3068321 RepID=A0ABU0YYH3_9MICO|nr:DUF389 domain-containing protein [Microbacterium sp. QXD-8]MDQ7876810.1 DUF389 domain-containing protein [Microbacterium sp. QXD-8]